MCERGDACPGTFHRMTLLESSATFAICFSVKVRYTGWGGCSIKEHLCTRLWVPSPELCARTRTHTHTHAQHALNICMNLAISIFNYSCILILFELFNEIEKMCISCFLNLLDT
jgi:hypothetical protein